MTRPTPESDVMHVFFIEGSDLVVAHDSVEAERLWRESAHSEELTLADYPAPDVEQWPDDKLFTITYDDAPKGSEKQRRTCGEWARENGPGFLASTEW
jgi:hypothetical protein